MRVGRGSWTLIKICTLPQKYLETFKIYKYTGMNVEWIGSRFCNKYLDETQKFTMREWKFETAYDDDDDIMKNL